MEFSSASARRPCEGSLPGKDFPEQCCEKKVFARHRRRIAGCGKVVQSVCNTSKAFAHFSLALGKSIGDNPRGSKRQYVGPANPNKSQTDPRGMRYPARTGIPKPEEE